MVTPEQLEQLPFTLLQSAGELQQLTVEQIAASLALFNGENATEIRKAFARDHKRERERLAKKAENRLINILILAALINTEKYVSPTMAIQTAPISDNILDQISPELRDKFIERSPAMQRSAIQTIEHTLPDVKTAFENTGFVEVFNKRVQPPIDTETFFQREVNNAIHNIATGEKSYNEVLKSTVRKMTDSGLRVITQTSGRSERIDVAVRRAVMTGIHNVIIAQEEARAREMGVTTFEITWHEGHRPSHGWGGRRYSRVRTSAIDRQTGRPFMLMDELFAAFGGGTLDDFNCRHSQFAIEPNDPPTYSNADLRERESAELETLTYRGKEYSGYEARQQQRYLERRMRKLRLEAAGYKAAGLNEDLSDTRAKYALLRQQYKRFSDAMGLKTEFERVYVDNLGRI